MRFWLRSTPTARKRVRDVAAWYAANASSEIAADFLTDFQTTVALLRSRPYVHALEEQLSVRRAHLRRFPYTAWYDVHEQTVRILTLSHDRMDSNTIRTLLAESR
ncbi:MAG: type II toxin-antitoxin system RelE/ParE family toxin [Propionibacteriaceae bacterium]|nr:type II toxin-antitoxin system RelE/ParE family toxin [Propionibacteriaceae bacterium]